MKTNRKAKSPENRERNKAKRIARKAKKAKERNALTVACFNARNETTKRAILGPIDTGKRIYGMKVYSLIS